MDSVEAELVNNKLKVEKVVYANQNNKYRLDQAESKLNKMDDIENKAQKTYERVSDAEDHLISLDGWVNNIDSALESQHYDLEDTNAQVNQTQLEIELIESNVDKLHEKTAKTNHNLHSFKQHMLHKTESIIERENELEETVKKVKLESADFTSMIDTVSTDVRKHHVAFETGLRTASTSAAYAKQTASQAKNTLEAFIKRTNRSNSALFGKINRQNDLLAFLMNKVQKLEQDLANASQN